MYVYQKLFKKIFRVRNMVSFQMFGQKKEYILNTLVLYTEDYELNNLLKI